jgi:hypothetical protein
MHQRSSGGTKTDHHLQPQIKDVKMANDTNTRSGSQDSKTGAQGDKTGKTGSKSSDTPKSGRSK